MADEKNEVDPVVADLKSQIEKLTANNSKLVGELRVAKGGISAEEAARLGAELDTAKAENIKLTASLKKATDDMATATTTHKTELEKKSATIQRLIRDEGLVKSLTALKTLPELLNGAIALHRGKIEVDEEKGEAFATVDGVRKTLDEYLSGWAGSDEGKHYIAAGGNSGGGAAGSGGSGGGSKAWKDMSLDERTSLYNTNPAQYNALKPAE
ncbi:MAG TPA: hypothetical protein VN437_06860 [Rectinemataceae bacterium]|nr:hypothetical protein [Rectinemataceae bacterium]